MSRLHWIVALLVTTIVPGYSWHDGSGWLAWTMFSKSETYRLHVIVTDAEGTPHRINPTELAALSEGDAATFLSGAEHWRHAPIGAALRSNLPSLALLACGCATQAVVATIAIDMRKTLDANPSTWRASAHCPPAGHD
jgi:hypothetical protein